MATRQRATLHVQKDADEIFMSDQERDIEARALALARADLPGADEETDVDRVAGLLQMASGLGRASVKVYRVENGKLTYCESYEPSEFEEGDFSMIRDSFGAGQYKIMLYGANPQTGKFGIVTYTLVSIAENRTSKSRSDGAGGDAMPAGLAQVLQSLAVGQQTMLEALIAIKQTPQPDPMANMSQMFGLMGAMREAMGINNRPQQSNSSISEMLAAMREMRAAAAEIMPEKSDDSLAGMLPQVLGIIQQGMTAHPASVQQQALQPVTIPQSIQAATPAQAAPTENPDDQMKMLELAKLRLHLNTLVSMAKEAKPHSEGAQFIYDKLPDDMIELLFADNWYEGLCLLAAEVKPYQAWLTAARALVLPMFDEPAQDGQ